jgi:histone acetyltransferase HTATIP
LCAVAFHTGVADRLPFRGPAYVSVEDFSSSRHFFRPRFAALDIGKHMAPATPVPSKGGKELPKNAPSPAQVTASDPPKAIITQGPHTLGSIVRGCKLFVERPNDEPRKAEILSIRDSGLARRNAEGASPSQSEGRLEYYVHYVEFNKVIHIGSLISGCWTTEFAGVKRLDEWIPGSRLILDREVEWPLPPSNASSTATPSRNKAGSNKSGASTPTGTPANKGASGGSMLRKAALKAAASVAGHKRKAADDEEGTVDGEDEDAEGEDDEAGAVVAVEMVDEDADAEGEPETPAADINGAIVRGGQPAHFSKEQEIEKLRTSGSMTQSHAELSRVKNLDRIQMGRHEVEAWYFSPYPKESVLYNFRLPLGDIPG